MAQRDEQGSVVAGEANGPMFSPAAWLRIWPFLAYIGFIIGSDLLERAGIPGASLRWLYALKIGVVLALLVAFWRQFGELAVPRLPWRAAVLSALVGAVVLVLWIKLNAGWMIVGSAEGFDPRTGGQIDWLMVMVRIAGAALVVPVMEELFWRSFLLRWIDAADFESVDPAHISWRGFVVTVILFGFEHNLWLAGMVAGAAYTVLYVRYRNLWAPILAHAVTNGLLGLWIISTGNWTYW